MRPATGDLELSWWCMETCWPRWGELVNTLSLVGGVGVTLGVTLGVTDLSLVTGDSLLPALSFLVTGGEVEKLLCSDRERSLVSLTGRGFLTLS